MSDKYWSASDEALGGDADSDKDNAIEAAIEAYRRLHNCEPTEICVTWYIIGDTERVDVQKWQNSRKGGVQP